MRGWLDKGARLVNFCVIFCFGRADPEAEVRNRRRSWHSIFAVVLILAILVIALCGSLVWDILIFDEWRKSIVAVELNNGFGNFVSKAHGALQFVTPSTTATSAAEPSPGSALNESVSFGDMIEQILLPTSYAYVLNTNLGRAVVDNLRPINVASTRDSGYAWLMTSWPNETAAFQSVWQLSQDYQATIERGDDGAAAPTPAPANSTAYVGEASTWAEVSSLFSALSTAVSDSTGASGVNMSSILIGIAHALGVDPQGTAQLESQFADAMAALSAAIPSPPVSVLCKTSGATASFLLKAASLGLAHAASASASAVSFVLSVALFLNLLYYLLAAERDWLTSVLSFLPGVDAARGHAVVSGTIRQVFVINTKVLAYHALFTLLVLRLANAHFVYTCVALSALGTFVPFFSPFLVALPAAVEIALVWSHWFPGLLLFSIHGFVLSYADYYFYESTASVHPSVLGLAIIAGTVSFGAQGAIIGPLLVSVLWTCYKLLHEQLRIVE